MPVGFFREPHEADAMAGVSAEERAGATASLQEVTKALDEFLTPVVEGI